MYSGGKAALCRTWASPVDWIIAQSEVLSQFDPVCTGWETTLTWIWDTPPFVWPWFTCSNQNVNKKVLLRERKRHTARRVASTPYVVLTGYPPSWPGGVPDLGTPPGRVPPSRVPPGRVHPGRVPPRQGTPSRVPPLRPMAFWVMLQSIMGYGYPPCGQTDGRTDACQNITFPSYYVRGR